MSFRVKTIVTLVLLAIAPYVITMLVAGNAWRSDFEQRVRSNMTYQLGMTVDRLDQNLLALGKDMHFIASLDIMNDVLTGDLDKRITDLLAAKKADLELIGDFDVTDAKGNVIASSDIQRVGHPEEDKAFMSVPIRSTFDNGLIGELSVHYSLVNLTRLFANDQHLNFTLSQGGIEPPGQHHLEGALTESRDLSARPDIRVTLEQDRDYAFSILDNVVHSFYIALAIGIGVIGTVAWLAASHIVHPILLLSSTARSITRTQDYSQRVELDRRDEIGQLASAFNHMITGMQDMIEQLKRESENRIKLAEEKNRAEMLQTLSTKLSKYLSPQIYESIFSGETDVTLTSSRKKLTIFFSDIVNFTGTTDQMESEDLTHLLNHYLSEMTEIALRYGATVDKYVGDGIMIFFGDPQSKGVAEDARLCVEMALAMQERVRDLQGQWQSEGFSKPFSIRVGIHTGYCTVGNFGTESRMDYTIVGSAVNLASRIESNAEPGTVYISEDTWLLVKSHIDCVPAASVTPKGLSQPIQLYKVQPGREAPQKVDINQDGLTLQLDPSKLDGEERERIRKLLAQLAGEL